MLPPCTAVLHLQATGSNAVAYLWRNSENPRDEFPLLEESGWTSTGELFRVHDRFPSNIEELSMSEVYCDEDEDYTDEYKHGSNVHSEDELD